jgi:hypothetical protein
MRKLLLGSTLLVALLCGGFAQAQMGKEKVGGRHPNLAAAQRHIEQALTKIDDAQRANEFDLGGHAKKAKELLDEAYKEIKEAAHFANERGKKGQPQ